VIRPDHNSEHIDPESQSIYCSGVRILLYLTKYARSYNCNDVRDLYKCMDDATIGTYLELLRVIKFVLDTENFGLKIRK
jgi:hypothetical protein